MNDKQYYAEMFLKYHKFKNKRGAIQAMKNFLEKDGYIVFKKKKGKTK